MKINSTASTVSMHSGKNWSAAFTLNLNWCNDSFIDSSHSVSLRLNIHPLFHWVFHLFVHNSSNVQWSWCVHLSGALLGPLIRRYPIITSLSFAILVSLYGILSLKALVANHPCGNGLEVILINYYQISIEKDSHVHSCSTQAAMWTSFSINPVFGKHYSRLMFEL